ncbi:HAD family hydrolase [Streptomyces sp. NPDC058231]|uniref:HAD family hydrolase n=1 Tax=Streptomyces sp. NPDC058231 TaxID=3346392 RepID=UPI0036EC8509
MGKGGLRSSGEAGTLEQDQQRPAGPLPEGEGETVAEVSGIVVDWGGVLTRSFAEGIAVWAAAEGVDAAEFHAALGRLLGPRAVPGPAARQFHLVERGELPVAEFEATLAALVRRSDGSHPVAEGLVERMFAPFTDEPAMVDLLRVLRDAGLKVALLSNSWGHTYDRRGWDGLFDAVVISCEVGLRKPEPEVFRHTARLLDRRLEECLLVDDLGRNVRAARALGMAGVHHRTPRETALALAPLLAPAGRQAVLEHLSGVPSGH